MTPKKAPEIAAMSDDVFAAVAVADTETKIRILVAAIAIFIIRASNSRADAGRGSGLVAELLKSSVDLSWVMLYGPDGEPLQ